MAAMNAESERKTMATKPFAFGVLTPARDNFFQAAMRQKKSPETFRALADQFDSYGLPIQAKMLRARADSRAADKPTLAARRKVVAQNFASKDPKVVLKGADICEQLGMTEMAGRMREYAKGLKDSASV